MTCRETKTKGVIADIWCGEEVLWKDTAGNVTMEWNATAIRFSEDAANELLAIDFCRYRN